jgi:hypothetical protein
MQLRAVRRGLTVLALALLPAIAGCSALGLGSATPATPATSAPGTGNSWVVVQGGRAPSPGPSIGAASPSASPSALLGSAAPGCPADGTTGSVMIPMTVTVGTGSLTATWPSQHGSDFRIAAVPQRLVSGVQPAVAWQHVAAGSGCTVTATVGGLTSGKAYILWLDAPNAGTERDGTPHPYSGRTGVLYPN